MARVLAKLGRDSKLYYSTNIAQTSIAEPETLTWVELDIAHDIEATDEKAQIEMMSRRNNDNAYRPGRRNVGRSITMDYAPGDSVFEAFAALYVSGAEFAIADMDGDIATVGSTGTVLDVKAYSQTRTAGSDDSEQTIACPTLPTGTYRQPFTVGPTTAYAVVDAAVDVTSALAVGNWENVTGSIATLWVDVAMTGVVSAATTYSVEIQVEDSLGGGTYTTVAGGPYVASKASGTTTFDFNVLLAQVSVPIGYKVQLLVDSSGLDSSVGITTTWHNNL